MQEGNEDLTKTNGNGSEPGPDEKKDEKKEKPTKPKAKRKGRPKGTGKRKAKATGKAPKQRTIRKKKVVAVNGVDYDYINGAACPACYFPKVSPTRVMPWENKVRIRYHTCRRCGHGFKSIQIK